MFPLCVCLCRISQACLYISLKIELFNSEDFVTEGRGLGKRQGRASWSFLGKTTGLLLFPRSEKSQCLQTQLFLTPWKLQETLWTSESIRAPLHIAELTRWGKGWGGGPDSQHQELCFTGWATLLFPVYLPGRGALLSLSALSAVIEMKLFVPSCWQLCAGNFHHF